MKTMKPVLLDRILDDELCHDLKPSQSSCIENYSSAFYETDGNLYGT